MNLEFKNLVEESQELQEDILNWRNSEDVRIFFQIKHITMNQHQNWLHMLRLKPKEQVAFTIYLDSFPIGLVYFRNITKIDCDWGMYIYNKELRGQGIGYNTLKWSIDYAKNNLNIKQIKLEVKKDNLIAINCYKKLGFKFVKNKNESFCKYCLLL